MNSEHGRLRPKKKILRGPDFLLRHSQNCSTIWSGHQPWSDLQIIHRFHNFAFPWASHILPEYGWLLKQKKRWQTWCQYLVIEAGFFFFFLRCIAWFITSRSAKDEEYQQKQDNELKYLPQYQWIRRGVGWGNKIKLLSIQDQEIYLVSQASYREFVSFVWFQWKMAVLDGGVLCYRQVFRLHIQNINSP